MKKFLAALLVGAFGLSAVAQTVVYDYKATFKRLDPQYKIRTINSQKKVVESYGVKSDNITGFIILPVCVDCENGTMDYSFTDPMGNSDFSGVGYFVRKDNKLIKNAGIEWVTKTNVQANAAVFGKNAYVIDTDKNNFPFTDGFYNVKNLNNAWMALEFEIPGHEYYNQNGYEGDLFIKNITTNPSDNTDNIFVGFLGLDHMGSMSKPTNVKNRGFGSVKSLMQGEAYSMGLCGSSTTAGWNCSIIQSISGSMFADMGWEGTCTVTPMWDLCNPEVNIVKDALIAGTWSLKYNKNLTEASDKEGEILKKLKALSTDVKDIYIP